MYILVDGPVGNLMNDMRLRESILQRFFRTFHIFPTVEAPYPEISTAVAKIEAVTPVTRNTLEEDGSLPTLHELEPEFPGPHRLLFIFITFPSRRASLL